jgi:RNA polymerase-binding transcription factor DksA
MKKAKAQMSASASPYNKNEIAQWRRCLIDERQRLSQDIAQLVAESDLEGAGPTTHDAPDRQEKEVEREELDFARRTLEFVDHALEKIDGKSSALFGICEETGGIIERERLELMPWTTLSSYGAQLREGRSSSST